MLLNRQGALALAVAATTCAVGCTQQEATVSSSDSDTPSSADAAAHVSTTSAGSEADALLYEDAYCKAKVEAEETPEDGMPDMTACFGFLTNTGDETITIVAYNSPTLDPSTHYELHETVGGVMREKEGGFVIEPGETKEFFPGGDHFMIMEHPGAILPGEVLESEITMSDDSVYTIDIPVRDQASGEEDYAS